MSFLNRPLINALPGLLLKQCQFVLGEGRDPPGTGKRQVLGAIWLKPNLCLLLAQELGPAKSFGYNVVFLPKCGRKAISRCQEIGNGYSTQHSTQGPVHQGGWKGLTTWGYFFDDDDDNDDDEEKF